ncbi:DUF4974 domain-containing protein [Arenibacter sp. 6A1]|uniref:FecR family protein n=1 Tax=Arenibacter sp. 6A1 TaxID=2720391 RepID=UPI0014455151|nr:FecR family protein [Arenibacter sp. 6A1]NKI27585.1 DUF4974 domain-containing protein [Arenibacter sp. 6A1]
MELEHKETQVLLRKFVLNQCNEAEVERVISYIKESQASNKLPTVEEVKVLLEAQPLMTDIAADSIFNNIISPENSKDGPIVQRRSTRLWKYTSVAATILLFIGLVVKQNIISNESENFSPPKNQSVTLELDNGKIKVLEQNTTVQITDKPGNIVGTQKGNELSYSNTNDVKELEFNTLRVPYGKKFNVELSDGTKVFLNSGTVLTFPIKFLKGKERQVFLSGEAFFDVSKDSLHPFMINSNDLKVSVLGTKFNMASYQEDQASQVVLVEGSVKLSANKELLKNGQTTILEPGFKGSFDKEKGDFTTEKVLTNIYTSWMDGELVFREVTFNNILKKLERQFDVTILNENKVMAKEKFNASFKDNSLPKILEYFKTFYGIQYTISDNEITIK